MNHRSYPNADRALRQIDRHYPPQPVQVSEATLKLAEQAGLALARAAEVMRPMAEAAARMMVTPPRIQFGDALAKIRRTA